MRPGLVYRCSVELGSIFNDTQLVLGPQFIEDSYVDFSCSAASLEEGLVFLVKSILDVCRDKVDYRGESGIGLQSVGFAVNCEAPSWFGQLEPVIEGAQMKWKPGIQVS